MQLCHAAKQSGVSVSAGYGFGLWMLGSLACTFVPSFWVLVTCRVIMGAGEASIITLTGPFIDDVAPPAEKTLWFGVLNVVRAVTPLQGMTFAAGLGQLSVSTLLSVSCVMMLH